MRIYRLQETGVPNAPPRIEETGFFIPAASARNPTHTIQINDAIVDAKGFTYAIDRSTGGLYVLEYTGAEPLD